MAKIGDIALQGLGVFMDYLILFENKVLCKQGNCHINCFILLRVDEFDCFEWFVADIYGEILLDHKINSIFNESELG